MSGMGTKIVNFCKQLIAWAPKDYSLLQDQRQSRLVENVIKDYVLTDLFNADKTTAWNNKEGNNIFNDLKKGG